MMGPRRVSIQLDCKGFFRSAVQNSVPDQTGVYFVYAGVKTETGCSIRRLLYIGRSANLHLRLTSPESFERLQGALQPGEELFYAYAFVASEEASLVERALALHFSGLIFSEASASSIDLPVLEVEISLTGDGVPRIFTAEDRTFVASWNSGPQTETGQDG